MRRLARVFSLSSLERRLAMSALALLAGIRLRLALLAFARVRGAVDRWASRRDPRTPEGVSPRAVRLAVARASRVLPGSSCLALALSAEVLLRRHGLPARVTIGVAPGERPGPSMLNAHAWTVSAGTVVAGAHANLESYRTLAVFESH